MAVLDKSTTTDAVKPGAGDDSREHAPVRACPSPQLHRFSVEDFFRLGELGILKSDEHFELIDGGIYRKVAPSGFPHNLVQNRLAASLLKVYGADACVLQGTSILLSDDTLLEPDVAVLRGKDVDYLRQWPTASAPLLIAEVSDTSLRHDRSEKLTRYAAAGIPIYLIADVKAACVEIHTKPEPAGEAAATYGNKQTVSAQQTLVLPAGEFAVAELFPWIEE